MIDNKVGKKKRPFKMIHTDEIPKHLFSKSPEAVSLYLYLKLRVWNKSIPTTYKSKEVILEAFEIPRSIRDLAKKFNTTNYKINKWLDILRNERMIQTNVEAGFTRIKILETRQNMERTPPSSSLEDDSENNIEVDETANPDFRTVPTSSMSEGLDGFNDENSTQYNIKSLLFRGENNKEEVVKNENQITNPKNDIVKIVEHINSNFEKIGNGAINLDASVYGIRKKISTLIESFKNAQGLKMEISKFFQGVNSEQRFDVHFGTLYDYLMNKFKPDGNK